MLASSAHSALIFSMKSGLCRMTLKIETRLTARNAADISASTKENITSKEVSNNSMHVSPLKKSLITDHILSTDEYQLQQGVKRIKEIMGSKLREGCDAEELVIIDTIQRLGLSYYFQDDIQAALDKHYKQCSITENSGNNLHDAALRFRLLRQQGYNVPADIFSKFKYKDGNFDGEVGKDIKGLMSLFEASHLSIPGECVLDDAGEFSTGQLLKSLEHVEQSEAKIIGQTLSNPCHRSLPRLTANNFLHNFEVSLNFLHDYNDNNKWTSDIQDLARIDITMAQIAHQVEVTRVSKWWKELRLSEELKLARNRPGKWHMWSLAILPAPNMAEQRLELTKAISFVYIIDDIFDVYGTIEELALFTEAVNRWEYANIKGLPNYMKSCLKALYDTTKGISHEIYNKHGWNPSYYLQKVWADLCNAYLVEAKWFTSGHIPTTEEYLKNRIVSTGVDVTCLHIFVLLAEGSNQKSINLLNSHPNIVSSTATILRLWNDIGSGKDQNQNGHDGSFIACYINEHEGSTAENAREHALTMISDAWKCLNETCMSHSPFSEDIKAAMLNLARMVPKMYI